MRQIHQILEEVDSTQLEFKRELARDPEVANLSFIQAIRQTGGKGRHDRQWASPEGNLYCSFLLRGPHAAVTWIPLWVAVSLRRAISHVFSPVKPVRLKWPNDLIVEPFAKLSGILCEKIGEHILVGVGVNVAIAPKVEGRELVSIRDLAPKPLTEDAVEKLKHAFFYEMNQPFSVDAVRADFDRFTLIPSGTEIEWIDLGTQVAGGGQVVGLGEYGELKVVSKGREISLFSEEVTQVKKKSSFL